MVVESYLGIVIIGAWLVAVMYTEITNYFNRRKK